MKKIIALVLVGVLAFTNVNVYAKDANKYENYGEKFQDIMDIIDEHYHDKSKLDKEALFEKAIDGMLKSLDPYTNYMPNDEFEKFMGAVNNEFVGIGAVVGRVDSHVIVERVLPDSPAAKVGVLPNDIFGPVFRIRVEG